VAQTHLEIVTFESLPPIEAGVQPAGMAETLAAEFDSCLWKEIRENVWRDTITTVNIPAQLLCLEAATTAFVWRIIEELPKVRAVSVRAAEILDLSDAPTVVELQNRCQRRGVPLTCDFVLDAQADAGEAISNCPNPLTAVRRLSRDLQQQGIRVRWLIPLCPELVFRLESIFSLARADGCEPVLVRTDDLWSIGRLSPAEFNSNEALFAWDFITYRLLEKDRPLYSQALLEYYELLQHALVGHGCDSLAKQRQAVVLAVDTGIFGKLKRWRWIDQPVVAIFQDALSADERKRLVQRKVGGSAVNGADVAHVLLDGVRAARQWSVAKIKRSLISKTEARTIDSLNRVAIIGAYGGEHIGDTAILGGVLTRIHQRHGVGHAVLLSQRPAHSRHLVSMLDVPVEVSVESYEHASIRECLRTVEAVVFAGGPLMDLPKQLVRHLYIVALATRMKTPFFIEGIGCGPFVRRSSQGVARRLVQMAQRITVRTSDDANHPLVRGRNVHICRDPAFDYLETRGAELSRLSALDRVWLEKLLQGAEGRPLVGINIRPIRHEYTQSAGRQDLLDYTRQIESRFERRLAEGLRRFVRESSLVPRFIFFPMNAIQFGGSDLRSAFRIKRLLGNDVDFQTWEADASLDGIISLLRQLDAVIAMRFHAAVFALSQGCPVLGIDYRVGKRDKVAALLSDFDQDTNCARIDEMSADWLGERLTELSQSHRATAVVERTDNLRAEQA
jgi:polysaccharide pyruvyl transferase WcaK-like protein